MRILDPIAEGGPRAALAGQPVRSRAAAGVRPHLPDLALSGAVIAVVYLLLCAGGGGALFRDADAGWHIRAGEAILAKGALPHTDPFSFSKPGAPWMAWEWGSDVLVALTHRMAGLSGVAWLYALAIAGSVWMWFRLNWAAGGNFPLACLFAAPMLSTTNLHWLARPHVFGWLGVIGMVWFCEKRAGGNACATWRHPALVGVASAVWANLHGSFFLAPLIAIVYAAGAWLRPRIWETASVPPSAFLQVAGAAAVGSLANPYGWQLHRHVFEYLTNSALLDRIGEFQTFNFHAAGATQIVLALLLGAAGGFAALTARRPERFLLAMLLTAAALRSARLLPIAALVLLPLANGSITAVLANAQLAPRLRAALDSALDYGLRLRALDRGMNGYALVPLLAAATFFAIRATHPAFPPDQFPVAASSAVASLPDDARIFSSDKFGGYLIYRFAGGRNVFFDGRSDFYGADFLRRYERMVQVRPGWQKEFAAWHFTHALLPVDFSLVPALEAQGWTELYRDHTAVLLGGPGA